MTAPDRAELTDAERFLRKHYTSYGPGRAPAIAVVLAELDRLRESERSLKVALLTMVEDVSDPETAAWLRQKIEALVEVGNV